MNNLLHRFKERRGASGLEYGLLVGLIGVALITAQQETGQKIATLFCAVSNRLSDGTSNCQTANQQQEVPDCTTTTTVGTLCADGVSRFVGIYPSEADALAGQRLYVAETNAGSATWNDGSATRVLSGLGLSATCTAPIGTTTTHDYCSDAATNAQAQWDALWDGKQNTTFLQSADSSTDVGIQPHNAAALCTGTWFLPSLNEAQMMANCATSCSFPSSFYWTSSEYDVNRAWRVNFMASSRGANGKSSAVSVRCVHR